MVRGSTLADLVGGKNVEVNEEFRSELFGATSTKIERLNDKKDQHEKDSFCANFFSNKQRKTSTTLGSKISGIEKSHEVKLCTLSCSMRFISVFCDLFLRIEILLPCLPAQGVNGQK